MFTALKSSRSVLPAHRLPTVTAVFLSAIVFASAPVSAEQLRMDHESVTVEPIEVKEDSPEVPAELLNGTFEPIYEDGSSGIQADPVAHEPPTTEPLMSPEVAAEGPEAGMLPAAEHEQAADGTNAADTAPLLQAADSAAEPAPEPIGMDPLMEAAEAHAASAETDPVETGNQAREAKEITGEPAAVDTAQPATTPMTIKAASPAAKSDAARPQPNDENIAASSPDENKVDIFDKWAHSKFEARKEKAPHPLASQYPDNFVVVCEAGCADKPVEIVYMERRDARGPVNEKPLKSGVVASTDNIDCVGGCYNGRNAYGAIAATWDPSKVVSESEWMTTVKKEKAENASEKKSDSSSRWYERIN